MKHYYKVVTNEWKKDSIPFCVVVAIVGMALIMLLGQGIRERRLERKAEAMEKALLVADSQATNLENGIKECANEKPITIFLTPFDYIEVACKQIKTNAWNRPKGKANAK